MNAADIVDRYRVNAGKGFHLAEQGVEVAAEAVEFGDLRRWHAAVEIALAAGGVGHGGKALQRLGDALQQTPRQV